VGILYGDIGTSPLFVYSSTFRDGVGHPDDLLGALSLIIYSFLLFTVIKYVYIALRANDDGDGTLRQQPKTSSCFMLSCSTAVHTSPMRDELARYAPETAS